MKTVTILGQSVRAMFTPKGRGFYERLRMFEDTVKDGERIPVIFYGSAGKSEVDVFLQSEGCGSPMYVGLVSIKGMALLYGNHSKRRGCPVATIEPTPGSYVVGWMLLLTKEQFGTIARRECGSGAGRLSKKGKYRRAVLHYEVDGVEAQAITFVLRKQHWNFSVLQTAEDVLLSSDEEMKKHFRIYKALCEKGRAEALSNVGTQFSVQWNSKEERSS